MSNGEFRLSNLLNFVNRTSQFGLPPVGFVNGLPLVVIQLKKAGLRNRRSCSTELRGCCELN